MSAPFFTTKTAAAARLSEARVPYVCVVADPTMGGVTASFVALADIIVAEPGARVGFAGPALVEQTIRYISEDQINAEWALRRTVSSVTLPDASSLARPAVRRTASAISSSASTIRAPM